MSENSAIEWTDHTFNPWIGCTKVSPGCDHCYAERREDLRLHRVLWGPGQPRHRTKTWGDPKKWNAQPYCECTACGWSGEQRHAVIVSAPGESMPHCPVCGRLALKQRRARVFCASLADVFDNEVDPAWRADLLNLIADTPALDWLLLTKRIGNAQKMLDDFCMSDGNTGEHWRGWPNVWLGATIVNQEEADRDIPKLLATPARVRFLSIEPMLGEVDITPFLWGKHEAIDQICQNCPRDADCSCGYETRGALKLPALHWVIAGGESGPHARPAHPDWFRSLRDQCAAAGVPFLFKQHGEWAQVNTEAIHPEATRLPGNLCRIETPGSVDRYSAVSTDGGRLRYRIERVGKKAAGRLLDGVQHDGFPDTHPKAAP